MKVRLLILALLTGSAASTHAGVGGPYSDHAMSRSMQLIMMERSHDVGVSQGRTLSSSQVDNIESAAAELQHAAHRLHLTTSDARDASDRAYAAAYGLDSQVTENGQKMAHFTDQLDRADMVLANAQTSSAYIVKKAEEQAALIVDKANQDANDKMTNHDRVMTERVSCHLRNTYVGEVFACLTPTGWGMDVQVQDQSFLRSQMDFTSDKPRRSAISDLVEQIRFQTGSSIRLSVDFYPRLKDEYGNHTPIVVFSDGAKR